MIFPSRHLRCLGPSSLSGVPVLFGCHVTGLRVLIVFSPVPYIASLRFGRRHSLCVSLVVVNTASLTAHEPRYHTCAVPASSAWTANQHAEPLWCLTQRRVEQLDRYLSCLRPHGQHYYLPSFVGPSLHRFVGPSRTPSFPYIGVHVRIPVEDCPRACLAYPLPFSPRSPMLSSHLPSSPTPLRVYCCASKCPILVFVASAVLEPTR